MLTLACRLLTESEQRWQHLDHTFVERSGISRLACNLRVLMKTTNLALVDIPRARLVQSVLFILMCGKEANHPPALPPPPPPTNSTSATTSTGGVGEDSTI